MPAQIWMMGIALTEIVHHIYINFGVKPCHEHVNSQREKKLVAATRKKNEQLRLNNMQVDKIVSLSSYSQIFISLLFLKETSFRDSNQRITLTTTCGNCILLPKLFWPIVRKNCSSDRENFWNSRLKAENLQSFRLLLVSLIGKNSCQIR